MSIRTTAEPLCRAQQGPVELIIETRLRDIGDFNVRRLLPSSQRASVGPFVFFDHMGPAQFAPGRGMDVRPHPHVNLATVTYLFEGEILHRDSLGSIQAIRPGAINLMTAGRGIVHSERSAPDRSRPRNLHGLQLWIGLPEADEEIEPAFVHYPDTDIPRVQGDGVALCVLMGAAFGQTSPVQCYSPTLYLDADFAAGGVLELPDHAAERAVYVASGAVLIAGTAVDAGQMAVVRPGARVSIESRGASRVGIIGGEPLGHRFIWWNFVSSRRARIEQAGRDWADGRFAAVPGDSEFIPLPDR